MHDDSDMQLFSGFWVGAYPTTLIFSKALSGYIYLPAMYLATLGVGEILSAFLLVFPKTLNFQKKYKSTFFTVGVIISIAAKRIKNFAQLPSLIIGKQIFILAHLKKF